MPINIKTGERYNFDFKKLIDFPKKYYNSKQFSRYLSDWQALLYRFDNMAEDEYNFFVDKCKKDIMSAPEIFQFIQAYTGDQNPYIFHFNIDNIISEIKNLRLKGKWISVKKLSQMATYDKSIDLNTYNIKRHPIIICSLCQPKSGYLVIDGNTRLNYHLVHHKWFIKYIYYDIKIRSDFLFSIDWAIYNFVNETNILIQDYQDENLMELNIGNSKIYNEDFIKEVNKAYI